MDIVDRRAEVEIAEVMLHEGPMVVSALERAGVPARGIEAWNLAAKTTNRMRILVPVADEAKALDVIRQSNARLEMEAVFGEVQPRTVSRAFLANCAAPDSGHQLALRAECVRHGLQRPGAARCIDLRRTMDEAWSAQVTPPPTDADRSAIEATVRDYYEGWYNTDVTRMACALHPALVKRAFAQDPIELPKSTRPQRTRCSRRRPPASGSAKGRFS